VGSRISIAILCALLLGCQGPRPEVTETKLVPDPRDPGRQWVEVHVVNRSGGTGTAKLTVRLNSADPAARYQESARVELRAHEETQVRLHFPRPAAAATPEAEVRYPPD
jgi:hypothetical protein